MENTPVVTGPLWGSRGLRRRHRVRVIEKGIDPGGSVSAGRAPERVAPSTGRRFRPFLLKMRRSAHRHVSLLMWNSSSAMLASQNVMATRFNNPIFATEWVGVSGGLLGGGK